MKDKIRVLILDPFKKKLEEKVIINDIDTIHKELNCDNIDIVRRMIGNKIYLITCDDCGYLKERKEPSVLVFHDNLLYEVIVNNIMISNQFDNDISSLSDDDIEMIKEFYQKEDSLLLAQI